MTEAATKLRNRYLLSFYRWCVAESQAELLRNYSTLRSLPSTLARKYVAFMDGLRSELRAGAALAIIRRYHPEALKLSGEALTGEDQHWIQAFLDSEVSLKGSSAPDLYLATAARPLLEKNRLKKEVLGQIASAGFVPERFSGESVWRFTQIEEPLSLHTYIDFGGRVPLSYGQCVFDRNGKRIYEFGSLMQWHGISANTSWDLLTNDLITEAANTLRELCTRFSVIFKQLAAQS